MPQILKDFLFIDLEEGGDKPFEGLIVGEFRDMWGRDVAWSQDDIVAIATETKIALATRKAKEGDDFAGLPIEGTGHYNGHAVGWIKDINLAPDNQTILATPEWTEEGKEIIGTNKRRFFSPTVAQRKDGGTILGGTLTNWPAIRDSKDLPLMKPVALSDGRFTYGRPDDPAGVNSNILVQIRDGIVNLTNKMTAGDEDAHEGEKHMSKFQKMIAGLSPEEKAEAITTLVLESGGKVTEKVNEEIQKSLDGVDTQVAEKVNVRVEAELAKRETIAYSKELVEGGEAGKGLPVEGEEMEEFLLSLDAPQLKKAQAVFSAVLKTGVVDFNEKGGKGGKEGGSKKLSESMKKTVANSLEQGNSLEDFFKVNEQLGKMSDYDLTEFQKEEKKE